MHVLTLFHKQASGFHVCIDATHVAYKLVAFTITDVNNISFSFLSPSLHS